MGSLKAIALFLLAAWPLAAADYAVMRTGFRVRVERHEVLEGATRLYLPGGGWTDVNTDEIARFETEEYVPPPQPLTPSPQPLDLSEIVQASGERYGLDPDLIHSVIATESAGNARAVSPKGAAGLMQLMPDTARKLRVADVFDPAQNVEGGTSYLRQLLAQFGNNLGLALAAYNAGPQTVITYGGVPPYRETRAYVTRVITLFNKKKLAGGS